MLYMDTLIKIFSIVTTIIEYSLTALQLLLFHRLRTQSLCHYA